MQNYVGGFLFLFMTEKKRKSKISNILKAIFVIVILVGSVFWIIDSIDFEEFWGYLKQANYVWAIAGIPIIILSHVIRAIRWRNFLKPFTEAKSLYNLFSAVMVGYAVNMVLPRVGEILRPLVYSRREKVSMSSVFGTILIERVIDVIFLMSLLALSFFIFRDQIADALNNLINPNDVLIFVVGPVVALLLMIIIVLYTNIGENLLKITIKPISKNFYVKVEGVYSRLSKGFEFIKNPKLYFQVLLESAFMWFLYGLPVYFMLFAFDFDTRFGMGLPDAYLLLIIIGIAVTVAPSPGGIGVYHFVVTEAMTLLYPIAKSEALAFATITHGVNFLTQFSVGALFLLRENVKKIPTSEELDEQVENSTI